MTIWDSFTGRRPPSSSHSGSSASQSAQAQPPNSFYSESSLSPQESHFELFDHVPTILNTSIVDPSQLHPLANLDQDSLEFLTLEDSALSDLPGSRSALPTRGWSDDLCYGTGVTYLGALSLGGAWGLAEGLQRASSTTSPRLRLNYVLNAVTSRGPFLGNSAAVIAMMYNGFNSTIGHLRGKHDASNSVLAGALSGAVFKSTKGLKPMAISSGLIATVAGSWALLRKLLLSG